MAKQEHKLTVSFKVRSYEVDHLQEVSISTICDYFQEAAGIHAHELHFDISDLQKKGLTWILYKLQVKVHTFPKRWQSVQVTTWPSTGDGVRAYRDYQLHDESGGLLAVGLSQWMVLDIKKKKPVKMPDELMNSHYKTDHHVMELHKKNLPKLDEGKAEFITTAGLSDLDMNRHVNNVRYIDWITGYNLSGKSEEKNCRELIIQYASETKAGDKIYLEKEPGKSIDDQINYTLFKNEGKTVIANAATIWE